MNIFNFVNEETVPTLSYAWSYCLNIRIRLIKEKRKVSFHFVSNMNETLDSNDVQFVHLRSIEVEFSPINQFSKGHFCIHQYGVSPFDPIMG